MYHIYDGCTNVTFFSIMYEDNETKKKERKRFDAKKRKGNIIEQEKENKEIKKRKKRRKNTRVCDDRYEVDVRNRRYYRSD